MKLLSLFIAGTYAGDHHRNLKQHNQEKKRDFTQGFQISSRFVIGQELGPIKIILKSFKVIYRHQIMSRKIPKSIGVISPDNRFWNLLRRHQI